MMKRIFLFACFLLSVQLSAQMLPHVRYGSNEGLSNSAVYSIYQDRRGQMWFGTATGLSSFDGEKFVNYEMDKGASAFAIDIAELKSGEIRIATWGKGLCILKGNKILPFTAKAGTIPKKIKKIFPDSYGRLWLINGYEIGYLSNEKYFSLDQRINLDRRLGGIYAVGQLPDQTIIVATELGLYYYSEEKKIFLEYKPGIIPKYPYFSFCIDRQKNLVLCSEGKIIFVSDKNDVKIVSGGIGAKDRIWVAEPDAEGNVWAISFNAGLLQIRNDKISTLSSLIKLGKEQLNDLHTDAEGNLWIATYGAGVYRVSDFEVITYSAEDGFSNRFVLSICEDEDGNILVGTRNGLNKISKEKISAINLPQHNHPLKYVPMLYKDSHGKIWIGTNKNLSILQNNVIQTIQTEYCPSVMLEDKTGRIWGGDSRGLLSFAGGQITRDEHYAALSGRVVYEIIQDNNGRIWFPTDSGAYCIDQEKIFSFTKANSPLGDLVYGIRENSMGMWFASERGLSCLSNGKWKHFDEESELNTSQCYGLEADREGVLWIATNKGLSRFDGKNFLHYTSEDGLSSNEIQVLYVDKNNFLWVGTSNGLTRLKTKQPEKKISRAPIYITKVTTSDTAFINAEKIFLSPNQSSFIIDFVSYVYQNNSGLRYQYRLNDGEWKETTNRSVEFSSLQPGKYFFQVRAVKNNEIFSSNIASLELHLAAPFWRTWWFALLCFVALAYCAYLYFRWHVAKVRDEEKKKTEIKFRMIELEQQALNALMNPHFIFNALNSIQRYLNCSDPELAGDYLAKFARLIRLTFTNTQTATISLEEEIERIELYLLLEKMRFEEKLSFDILIAPGVNSENIIIPSMILQPFVENAIWHGIMPKDNGGKISLSVETGTEESIKITIQDDGIGINQSRALNKKSGEHLSSSMLLIEERLRLLSNLTGKNFSVHIEDLCTVGKNGTSVEIIFPLSYAPNTFAMI